MYERILVPIDGSITSERGLDEALSIASKFGSTIRLIHIVDEAALIMNTTWMATNVGELLSSLVAAGEQILAESQQRAKQRHPLVETVLRRCTTGRVADVILSEATEWPGDLIVIGTHGRRGASRLILGSDAEQVLRSSPVPVLLVRERRR